MVPHEHHYEYCYVCNGDKILNNITINIDILHGCCYCQLSLESGLCIDKLDQMVYMFVKQEGIQEATIGNVVMNYDAFIIY